MILVAKRYDPGHVRQDKGNHRPHTDGRSLTYVGFLDSEVMGLTINLGCRAREAFKVEHGQVGRTVTRDPGLSLRLPRWQD